MRKLIVGVLTCVLAGGLAAPALAKPARIKVGDNYFVRSSGVPTVTVNKGKRVKWVFRGKSPHNVKVDTGPASFGSSIMIDGSFTRKMTKRGTYRLYCSVHGPEDQSMKLVVR